MLAGNFWIASGWPWVVNGQVQPVFNATKALRQRTAAKSDDTDALVFEVYWKSRPLADVEILMRTIYFFGQYAGECSSTLLQ